MPRGINIYDEAKLQGRLWTPDILNPFGWFKSDINTKIEDASGINTWVDGKIGDATEAINADKPLSFTPIPSVSGVNFSTATKRLSITSPASWDDFSVFFTGRTPPSLAGTNVAITRRTATGALSYFLIAYSILGSSTITIDQANGTTGRWTTGVSVVANTDYIHSYIRPLSGVDRSYYLNGDLTGINTSNNINVTNNSPLYIGNIDTKTSNGGVLYEIVILNKAATNKEKLLIEGYLAWRQVDLGLFNKLPAVHPFRNRPPLIGD